MRFSGHETFPVREGWLHKGLTLVEADPSLFTDEYCADRLGVGSNMAKSIRHWLTATELVRPTARKGRQKSIPLEPTPVGRLILDRDPYFIDRATWWALHLNLVNRRDRATSWWWFFNHFHLPRFERPVCVAALRRYIEAEQRRVPSPRTLDRDVACLLASYARVVPPEPVDPEEALESPFVQLKLLSHFRTSGYYQQDQEAKQIPAELFGYALAKAGLSPDTSAESVDISLRDAAHAVGGPGRAFALRPEVLFNELLKAESVLSGELRLVGLAGEKVVRTPARTPEEWLKAYYDRQDEERRHAA